MSHFSLPCGCRAQHPAAEMPKNLAINEGIDLSQLHPAYANHSTDDFYGSQLYEWPGDTWDTWKRFGSYSPSLTDSRPYSVHCRTSRRSSIISNGSRRPSFEVPIVPQRLSYPVPKQPTGAEGMIDFDGKDDHYRPIIWPFRKKVITTVLYGFTTCWVTFASAISSAGGSQISDDFHVNDATSTAGISMVVFGFGLGPLLWAPLSEV